ncbi:hypothetical protein EJ02DRAFT_447533 [Clathrospora elynae]|uniref:Methyltransferase domain-containing protein n=1 Tax=Clathrospora elynae TaxID=706981 RepID=A0A6A5S9U9_9PLEO|nr:hypothetical protein EJ02DRAFT_447533 [Clathrospora elynae]
MSKPEEPQSTNVTWFQVKPTKDNIRPETQRLLKTYSGIPLDQVFDHVVKVRNEAWEVHPYPCIGQFRFLEPSFTELEEFDEVVERLRKGQKLLDMACCFGQTICQLVDGGAPAENITSSDLQSDFIYKFLVADIFDSSSALVDMRGSIDMGMKEQVIVSKAVAALLRPKPGSMILGCQIRAVKDTEKVGPTGTMYRHDVESFKKMWREIGDDLGVTFTVDAKLKMLVGDHFLFHPDDTRRIWFVIRRE